ncbi:MAG TPA: MarR family transcriptional regulator [Bradyrhizobium sp.]|jgi:DNA-binding MarR family transcriptional regulator|nr:MarR family transcriptional regulator [Bradyrhizobium sp.]
MTATHQKIPDLARTLLETCLCHNVRMASRVVSRAYDEALRPTGLRATQIAVLAAVGARGALSIKSLADSLEMERTTLTRNLKPLEEQALVSISPEGRHRSRTLTLTTAGKAALLKALPLWEKAQQSSMHQLGEQRWPVVQKAFADLIHKMHRAAAL